MGFQIPLACAAVGCLYRKGCARAGGKRLIFKQLFNIVAFILLTSNRDRLIARSLL
jgi:hypothetical protein